MEYNGAKLSVNTEVIERMAEIAALEVEGVESLTKKNMDLKGVVRTKTPFKSIKVENINGSIQIGVFVCVKQGINIKEVSEKIQFNIKDKIQTMTGSAVTKVNVHIADIKIVDET